MGKIIHESPIPRPCERRLRDAEDVVELLSGAHMCVLISLSLWVLVFPFTHSYSLTKCSFAEETSQERGINLHPSTWQTLCLHSQACIGWKEWHPHKAAQEIHEAHCAVWVAGESQGSNSESGQRQSSLSSLLPCDWPTSVPSGLRFCLSSTTQ